jgi:hypothetical protein
MNIPYKYLLLRFYAHIMLSLLAIYTILVSIINEEGLAQALIFFVAFICAIFMYKHYQKASMQMKLITPKEKSILEYSLYVYIGLYISRTILLSTTYVFLNLYIGIILLLIATTTTIMIYKMIK